MIRIAFALSSLLALGACGKDSNPQPDVPDARHIDAREADAAIDAPVSCIDETGTPPSCFKQDTCTPTQQSDFYNGCTDATCIAFDNAARLPLYNGGNLPALPN